MSIATLYVRANSKKAVNELLAEGKSVHAQDRSMVNERDGLLTALAQDGDVIKIYKKIVGDSPYVHAYGNWDAKKQRVK